MSSTICVRAFGVLLFRADPRDDDSNQQRSGGIAQRDPQALFPEDNASRRNVNRRAQHRW